MANNHDMTRFHPPKALLLTALGALHGGIWAQEPRPAPKIPVLSACAGEAAHFVIVRGVATPTGFSIQYTWIAKNDQTTPHCKFLAR